MTGMATVEGSTPPASVVALDLSWDMAMCGVFDAVRQALVDLVALRQQQSPRPMPALIGFSAYARRLRWDELPQQRWDDAELGTNLHHALLLAHELLGQPLVAGSKHLLVLSTGVPTAHIDRGRSYFAYPPNPITVRETLAAGVAVTVVMVKPDGPLSPGSRGHFVHAEEFAQRLESIPGVRVVRSTTATLSDDLRTHAAASVGL